MGWATRLTNPAFTQPACDWSSLPTCGNATYTLGGSDREPRNNKPPNVTETSASASCGRHRPEMPFHKGFYPPQTNRAVESVGMCRTSPSR